MGHTPHARTFRNAYMGDFGDMNMAALMLDQDSSVKTSLSPLTAPATFRIPDIKRFALSETEKTAALQDKKLDQLIEDRSHHRRVNTNDKDEKSKLNNSIKSRRRILIMRI